MTRQRMIVLEFNELCPSLLDRFMASGELPHFRRLWERSRVYVTDAGEAPPNLEPWIQWPTLHYGVPYSTHGVFHLGEGRSYQGAGLAKVLSNAGVRVGVFGSMNVNYEQLNGYLVPDAWDPTGKAEPDWLQPFYRTVAAQVQESSRNGGLSKRELIDFAIFLLRHGISPGTLLAIVRQLGAERFDAGVKWRRASLLDRIQYDVARWLNRRLGVEFATFFCNSTAHYQHYYWRNMEPERFEVAPSDTEHPSLRSAILFGYQRMDELIGRFLRDYSGWTIVLASALSQQPWVDTTKCTYRPQSFDALMEFAQIQLPRGTIKPVMAEEFTIECPSQQVAIEASAKLEGLRFGNLPLMKLERTGSSLFTGCAINSQVDMNQPITRASDGSQRRFGDLFYMIHGMRSGRHHPDGVLWIGSERQQIVPSKLQLEKVASVLLESFGLTMNASVVDPAIRAAAATIS